MKTKSAFPLFLLAILAGPAVAETATATHVNTSGLGHRLGPAVAETATDTQLLNGCQLVGPLSEATEDCKAMRVAFRTEVGDCMNILKAEAEARAGKNAGNNAHTSRARLQICDATVRVKMGFDTE